MPPVRPEASAAVREDLEPVASAADRGVPGQVAPEGPGLPVVPGSGVAGPVPEDLLRIVAAASVAGTVVASAAAAGTVAAEASSLPCLLPTLPSRSPLLLPRSTRPLRTSTTAIRAIAASAAGIAVAAGAVAGTTSVAIGKGPRPM